MNEIFLNDLEKSMAGWGFQRVDHPGRIDTSAVLLLKRQTWNTNRAVLVVSPVSCPDDFKTWLRQLRRKTAFRCRFLPLFWGIGIQIVVIARGISRRDLVPHAFVARIDNQWAIIQSLFLVDPDVPDSIEGRSAGQFVTGKFQDSISACLGRHFSSSLPKV